MKSDFFIAVTQLAAERNLPREMVIEAVEAALVSAYRKDNSSADPNIRVELDGTTGDIITYQLKTVVEEVTNEAAELTVAQAKKLKTGGATPEIGEILEFEMPTQESGRIAAQTAKQVVIQRLREAERELIFNEFSEREGEVFSATVQRGGPGHSGYVTVDLNGRAEATLPPSEQAAFERYRPGMKLKVMILEVTRTTRGPEIIVTRTHPDLLRRLFEMEVPEIYNGVVEIRSVAREAGSRSKVAVSAKQDGVDPVGACVGLRGIRIQNIVNELQGEKIDVIQWSRDPSVFISHALSPAQPLRVDVDEEAATANVVVPDRLLSLAIGREGQNARLAAKLTNWKVDVKSSTELEIERMKVVINDQVAEQEATKEEGPVGLEATSLVAEAEAASTIKASAAETLEETSELTAETPPDLVDVESDLSEETSVTAELTEPVDEPDDSGLTPEELLALESLDLNGTTEAASAAEEVPASGEIVIDTEEIWEVPEVFSDGPQIRFAEDILGDSTSRGGGRRRGGNTKRRTGSKASPRPNQARRGTESRGRSDGSGDA